MTKIIIEIQGGNIGFICSNQDIQFAIIDRDNIENGDFSGIDTWHPDQETQELADVYKDEPEIYTLLKIKGY